MDADIKLKVVGIADVNSLQSQLATSEQRVNALEQSIKLAERRRLAEVKWFGRNLRNQSRREMKLQRRPALGNPADA